MESKTSCYSVETREAFELATNFIHKTVQSQWQYVSPLTCKFLCYSFELKNENSKYYGEDTL